VHHLTCSLLWVRCLFDRFSISDFGGFDNVFRIPRRDTELRFVTKFGENRPVGRSFGLPHKKLGLRGTCPNRPPLRPKFPEQCHPLTCQCLPNLVRIGCAFPDLLRKDWFSGSKSNYIRLSAYNYTSESLRRDLRYVFVCVCLYNYVSLHRVSKTQA